MQIEYCIKLPDGVIPSDQHVDFLGKVWKFNTQCYSKLDLESVE